MKKAVLPVVILAAGVSISAILVKTPAQVAETSTEVQATVIRAMQVQPESITLTVESQGKVQAARRTSLSIAVAGQVEWLSPALENGGYIAAGEVLLRLDVRDLETAADRAEATLAQARAEAEHARTELERLQSLATQRLASDSQMENAQRGERVAAARLMDAEAALRQARSDLERAEIRAPFNAIVESKDVELGQYLNRAQTIATLVDADQVEVRLPLALTQMGYLDVPLGYRGELPDAMAPEVILTGRYGSQRHQWRGRLVRTEAGIDATSNSVQAIVRVIQPKPADIDELSEEAQNLALPLGLYVQAEIRGKRVDNLFVLPRSVIRNNNRVLVVDDEDTLHFREVDIMRLEDERVLIQGGLMAGERICLSPIQAVVDGMPVVVQEAG
ncbi:MAG: efflux RND transporter periplasmic adaptor subunit [Pseudohongiellaceae bacterium]